jgi:hypothetical protein
MDLRKDQAAGKGGGVCGEIGEVLVGGDPLEITHRGEKDPRIRSGEHVVCRRPATRHRFGAVDGDRDRFRRAGDIKARVEASRRIFGRLPATERQQALRREAQAEARQQISERFACMRRRADCRQGVRPRQGIDADDDADFLDRLPGCSDAGGVISGPRPSAGSRRRAQRHLDPHVRRGTPTRLARRPSTQIAGS